MPDAGMLEEFLAGACVDAEVLALRPDYRVAQAAGALFPTGDAIVVLWQPGTLPVLAPFLQDGQPALPFPEQTPSQRSESASSTGPSAMPAGGGHYLCYPARPPAAGLMMAAA